MKREADIREGKESVLFICTFNSARSQIAEGLLRARCGGRFSVHSAGIATAGLNPYAVISMQEIGIDISQQRSKPLTLYTGIRFDHVVTLCDHVRQAASGSIPQGNRCYHRGFISPSEIRRDKAAILADYRRLRVEMGAWLAEIFPDCTPQREKEQELPEP
jgi:arsenate reductase (thioredoxin)